MTQLPMGLVLEVVVIMLLVVTVGYCYTLNKRLKRLRNAQNDLTLVIRDLGQATIRAEQAISGLKRTADDAERGLTDKLHKAKLLTHNLSKLVEGGTGRMRTTGDTDWRQAG